MCLTQKQTEVLLCCHMKPVPESSLKCMHLTESEVTNLNLEMINFSMTTSEDKWIGLVLKVLRENIDNTNKVVSIRTCSKYCLDKLYKELVSSFRSLTPFTPACNTGLTKN